MSTPRRGEDPRITSATTRSPATQIYIPLYRRQIDHVVRELTGQSGARSVLHEQIDDLRIAVDRTLADLDPDKMSRSLLVALRIWTAFSATGPDRGVKELAAELAMTQSRMYRYVNTLVAIGLLERTATQKYRLPSFAHSHRASGPREVAC